MSVLRKQVTARCGGGRRGAGKVAVPQVFGFIACAEGRSCDAGSSARTCAGVCDEMVPNDPS